jgi:hypothetical protein
VAKSVAAAADQAPVVVVAFPAVVASEDVAAVEAVGPCRCRVAFVGGHQVLAYAAAAVAFDPALALSRADHQLSSCPPFDGAMSYWLLVGRVQLCLGIKFTEKCYYT